VSPRRAPALALAGLAALLACGGPARRLDEAMSLEREGRPREALAAYQAVLGELGEGDLPPEHAGLRKAAVRRAADVAYLQLGDYGAALGYYRRFVSLAPAAEARAARLAIAEIYSEKLKDPAGAIAQHAVLAAEGGPDAPRSQLAVAELYLRAGDLDQARTEARVLRERWPESPLVADADAVTGQAFAAEHRVDDAVRAFDAAARVRPGTDVAARALESAANLLAEDGRLERALEIYLRALEGHPNPDAVRTGIDATRRRLEAAGTPRVGDREAALDHQWVPKKRKESR
jgi:tetratricopeptide (TPR) repeat protein